MKNLLTRVFLLIFVVVGLIFIFFGVRDLLRANSSTSWPSVEGVIISSTVKSKRSDDGYTYHARIKYKYSANNQTFHGKRVAYGDYGSSNSSHARSIVNRYPPGKIVTVYYMPENPDESLLETGLKGQSWFRFGFGSVFFIFGTAFSILFDRKFKREQEKVNPYKVSINQ